ncbi:MAG: Bifunctional PGK/TIM [Candidatus Anoxychlamydiales bacterium]|nr:Bifunctional PGK/TIM [Candidatus Anoxychlamydiales bacterium]NGX35297.1 Bifunctional PGK/TIM [Candidatus Anoxychlamydiales bacterium]
MEKKYIIAGNWKMNKTHLDAKEFIKDIIPQVNKARSTVYIAVPFTALQTAVEAAKDTNIVIGAQNMHDEENGAFTGEISSSQLKCLDVKFVILGHSERRHIFKEDNAFINRKVIRALKDGLKPILCIGETKEEREKKLTHQILDTQFSEGIKNISNEEAANLTIAYEPVWAIGTGISATSEIAENTHTYIRKLIIKYFDNKIANSMHILYGGSVKPDNVEELMQQENIDGVLVGGAALKVESFAQIVNKA